MKNKKCNVCKKKFLRILDLGLHPCADTFVKKQKTALKLKKYPLQVGFCSCNHLTAINKISPNERYTKFDYSYTSNNSPVSRHHFYKISKSLIGLICFFISYSKNIKKFDRKSKTLKFNKTKHNSIS